MCNREFPVSQNAMKSWSVSLRVAFVAVGQALAVSLLLYPITGWKLAVSVGAASFAVGLVFVVIVARSVTGAIVTLGDEAKLIGEGGLQVRCEPQGPPSLQRLAHHINNIVKLLEESQIQRGVDVQEEKLYLEQSNRALIDLASRDTLTGLSNRRRLERELEQQMAASRENRRPLAVIMMDLDRFKVYNDTAGHLAGDDLLKTVANTLRSKTRVTDLVVRWGGDEFCILMPCSNTDGVLTAAQGLVDAVVTAVQGLPEADGVPGLGASAGVACFPEDAEEAQELIARADDALYKVKEGGRGHALRYSRGPG